MIFYRSPNSGGVVPLRVMRVRALTSLAFLAYPAGAILRLLAERGAEPIWLDMAGFALILAALASLIFVIGTGVARIVGEEVAQLDERELLLRQKAFALAFQVMGGIVLLALFYGQIATDLLQAGKAEPWLPENGEHWNALFCGGLVLVFILPTALLSWALPTKEISDEE
jgi:hypothetical protein